MKWETVRRARETLAAEQGAVIKDWGGKLPIALLYANDYYVGMSSLGLQTLYRLFNALPDIVAERAFWSSRDVPYSIESQQRLAEFGVVAVSLSFETDLLNLVGMLRASGIPVLASERDEDAALVLAGGPVPTANPELLAPLVDAVFVGEAEAEVAQLASVLVETVAAPRYERRRALSTVPGVYVPEASPAPVQRVVLANLDACPVHSEVLTPHTEFGGMYLIEISRGCPRGCRFCLAGYIYRPQRQRSVASILAQAEEGLRYRDTIGLVAAAVSDYGDIDRLVAGLRGLGARIAVSSLRAYPLAESLLEALAESGTQTLTLAPEAGSEHLRRRISKGITREHILAAAEQASRYGFPQLKLYFIVGLPGETDEDVVAIVDLVREVRVRFGRRITVQATPFVPKPQTPFEREQMADAATLEARIRLLTRSLRPMGLTVRSEGVAWARAQGVLSRGDRALGQALDGLRAPTLAGWRHMLRRAGLNEEDYLRARGPDERLPWEVVQSCEPLASYCGPSLLGP